MFPEKPVLWLSQSLQAPRDRAGTVENISIRVVAVIVSCQFYYSGLAILIVNLKLGVKHKLQ